MVTKLSLWLVVTTFVCGAFPSSIKFWKLLVYMGNSGNQPGPTCNKNPMLNLLHPLTIFTRNVLTKRVLKILEAGSPVTNLLVQVMGLHKTSIFLNDINTVTLKGDHSEWRLGWHWKKPRLWIWLNPREALNHLYMVVYPMDTLSKRQQKQTPLPKGFRSQLASGW